MYFTNLGRRLLARGNITISSSYVQVNSKFSCNNVFIGAPYYHSSYVTVSGSNMHINYTFFTKW